MQKFALTVALLSMASCRQGHRPAEEMRRASWGEPSYEIIHSDGRGTEVGMRGSCEDSPFPLWLYYLPLDREPDMRSYLDAGTGLVHVSIYARSGEGHLKVKAMASGPAGKPVDFTPILPLPEDSSLPSNLPADSCETVVRSDLRPRR